MSACPYPHCDKQPPCMVHCIYCGVDCDLRLPHADDCPQTTGLYPNRVGDICIRCKSPDMEYYVLAPIADDIAEVICVGCAAVSSGETAT